MRFILILLMTLGFTQISWAAEKKSSNKKHHAKMAKVAKVKKTKAASPKAIAKQRLPEKLTEKQRIALAQKQVASARRAKAESERKLAASAQISQPEVDLEYSRGYILGDDTISEASVERDIASEDDSSAETFD